MTVPAPGQDNPQAILLKFINDAAELLLDAGYPYIEIPVAKARAALEAATRERDDYAGYGEILESLTVRAEAAERALAEKHRKLEDMHTWGSEWKTKARVSERALEAARDALRFYANPSTYEEMSPLDEWEGSLTGPIPIKDFDHYGDRARSALDASASTGNTP